MAIFQSLVESMCTKGLYLLFNAFANQLRYPNSHTHFFNFCHIAFFLRANPHPWGLLVAFVELIRNEKYEFWKHEFVRCAPEIQRLFVQ
uniref:CCR4-Not complex component Not1 C-terminal domain-containing protein n=1 Tax=Ditylenchus dipsaci TaxID=166011 RepID=A0A915E723_9BILA